MPRPLSPDRRPGDPSPVPLVRAGIHRVTAAGLAETPLAGAADELVLLVELSLPRNLPAGAWTMAVEFLRGEGLRDRKEERVELQPGECWTAAYRLHWTERSNGSSRLTCRITLDGRLAWSHGVLLGKPAIDPQGRLSSERERTASAQTLAAFAGALDRLLQ